MSFKLIDPSVTFDEAPDGALSIRKDQEIADDLLQRCADARFASKDRSREFHQVASIPTIIVEQWLREGYDVFKEPVAATLKRLRERDLDAFITTNKRV